MVMDGLTEQEKKINELLVQAHNEYIKLDKQHRSDLIEWINSIHKLEMIIGIRVARRHHPEIYVIEQ